MMMKQKISFCITLIVVAAIMMLAGIGTNQVLKDFRDGDSTIGLFSEVESQSDDDNGSPVSADSGEFISGPLVAEVGELCIFRLREETTRADWTVVRQSDKESPTLFYVDSSGSALTFSSNIPAKYTVVAAVIEDGKPRVLQHAFQYGLTPPPLPGPNPEPEPTPKPDPEPQPEPANLSDWVRQNIPDAGKFQAAALASCYDSAAMGIERGSIKSPEAAFSAIRTCTQTKVKLDVWKVFLDKLSEKVNERFSGNRDIRELAAIFKEIAEGLRKSTKSQSVPTNEKKPMVNQAYCNDPTCQTCSPQPWRYGGRR